MGNNSGKPSQETNEYKQYINEQQRIIQQQSQQINQLSQQMQQSQQYRQPQQPQQSQQPRNQPQFFTQTMNPPSNNTSSKTKKTKTKLDPYKILSIDKNYDETSLKKAYLKKAMVTHPDKGGSEDEFQKVSIAFAVLKKKLSEREVFKEHQEMKINSQNELNQQPTDISSMFHKSGDRMTNDLFNKIYEENRSKEQYDDGYNDWIQENHVESDKVTKMFDGKFNKDMFHQEFSKYKKEKVSQQMVEYKDPEESISYGNKHAIMELGGGKIKDFSGTTESGLNYRDYRDAFTNSLLIDAENFDIDSRDNSLQERERIRETMEYTMSDNDRKKYEQKTIFEQQAEQERLNRLQKYDQAAEKSFTFLNQKMLPYKQ